MAERLTAFGWRRKMDKLFDRGFLALCREWNNAASSGKGTAVVNGAFTVFDA